MLPDSFEYERLGTPGEVRYVEPGERLRVRLPHSEVCCHMRVAGTVMDVEVIPCGSWPMVQILTANGMRFSATITLGEAGFYRDADGRIYTYAVEVVA